MIWLIYDYCKVHDNVLGGKDYFCTGTMNYSIREKSVLAWLASLKLKQRGMAVVWGSTIHLHGVRREEFLANEAWLRHELEHVRQFRQYGMLRFLYLYLLESLRKGYKNNRFEIEARNAEGRTGNGQ